MYKIMIIEDDKTIMRELESHLNALSYDVYTLKNFNNILEEVSQQNPDLILLDVMLPFKNGFYYCAEIRKFSTVPIIFISGASDNLNIITAMDLGGDDFIAKPFDLNVLSTKVNSLLRRSYSYKAQANTMELKGVMLDLNKTKIYANNKEEYLTKNEFIILKLLMENEGAIVSRYSLMDNLWSTDAFIDDNTLSVNIVRLRKKLATLGFNDYIKTKKGEGYFI
ncbi:MAG: response regulator transcription factor [Christensenellaceae bacterium]|nr:response regulator transcription factor [Christensenellaceae bacterium]